MRLGGALAVGWVAMTQPPVIVATLALGLLATLCLGLAKRS